ncbi:hypothetical protein GCM10025858_19330 [Alicyclobacillus sacchari]|nr:NUDIX domain-containing protein [Alicyclobacillus sacchari]GMA57430.1 hypothetical protein GCM10025858_19330 [Alicyclobacillus sacchari]
MLLLQRRHLGKDTNPGKLDVSCAGHLAAGESPEDGVRELQEELGVAVSPQRLLKIGVARHQFRGNGVIDNEFSHVFVLRCHDVCDLHKFNVATDEVSGLYRISVRDLRGLVEGEVQSTEVAGIRWTDTGWEDDIRIVREADLVHREPSYYRLLWRHFGVL